MPDIPGTMVMNTSLVMLVIGLSVAAQVVAAWMAMRQMSELAGRHQLAWGCLSLALMLMVERRALPLWRMAQGESVHALDAYFGLLISLLMLLGVWGIRHLFADMRSQTAAMERLARTDVLTGLPNRRDILARAQAELDRSLRTRHPVSLLMLDLDHFKAINDQYGHPIGDVVLRAFARIGQARMRRIDALGRIGGEEFLVVLPETDGDEALAAAERLRLAYEQGCIETTRGIVSVTVSIGAITHRPGETDRQIGENTEALLDRLLARVDAALYEAKQAGRNRVVAVAETDQASR